MQSWLGLYFREKNDKFYVQPEFLLVSEQSNPAPNEVSTPGYAVLNLKAGLNLHKMVKFLPYAKLIVSVTNLGDKSYRSHVSRGAPGNQNVFLEAGRSINLAYVTRFGAAVR